MAINQRRLNRHILRRTLGPPSHWRAAGKGVNAWLAVKITKLVGTMWCAYLFALFALISLGDAIHQGRATIVTWVAQTFLQLVLLSIIIVGQNISAAASDARAKATYDDADAILTCVLAAEEHLVAIEKHLHKDE